MIKEKDLREMRPRVRFDDKENIVTLRWLKDALTDYFQEADIPVAFRSDTIKFGGLVGGSTQECLVLYHPQHEKDYFKLAVHLKRQGKFTTVTVNDFGESRLLGNMGSREYLKETLSAEGSDAYAIGEKVGAVIGAGIRALIKGGVNKQKLQDEQDWYQFVEEAFDEIVAYMD